MERVKESIAGAVRAAIYTGSRGDHPPIGEGLVAWRHEMMVISPLVTQIKVWGDGPERPPRYFTITVSEQF